MPEFWEAAFVDRQLMRGVGGSMIFTVISKAATMYGRGARLGDDGYENLPGVKMYFCDVDAAAREFGAYGLVELSTLDERANGGRGRSESTRETSLC